MSMKLVILGLLLEGDKHPYEVQHIMKRTTNGLLH